MPLTTTAVAALAALLLMVTNPGRADEPTAPTPEVRRIFVPADKPELWPTAGRTFLPIERSRLDQLLKTAPTTTLPVDLLRIEARFSDDNRLVGAGSLRIDAARPTFVEWPCSTETVTEARWQTGEAASFGWWPAADGSPGAHGFVAQEAGEMTFRLRTPPVRWNGSRAEVSLATPLAMRRVLEIETPSWLRVRDAAPAAASSTDANAEATTRWRLEAPPGQRLTIRLEDRRPVESESIERFAAVERTRLEVRPEGVRLQTEFRLTAEQRLPDRVRVLLPEGAFIETAAFGDGPLAPLRVIGASEDPSNTTVEVTLPPTPSRRTAALVFDGWAVAPHDADWTAPRPRLLGAEWTEGALSIELADRMTLVDVGEARDATPLLEADDLAPGAMAYRLITADAQVSLCFRVATDRMSASVSRVCQLGEESDQATVRLKIESIQGAAPTELELDLINPWRADSVEATPAGLLDRWSVDLIGGMRRLRLTMAEGATADDLVGAEFVVAAERRRSSRSGPPMSLDALGALRTRGVDVPTDRLVIRGRGSRALVPMGVATRRVLREGDDPDDAGPPPIDFDRLALLGAEQLHLDLTGMPTAARRAGRVRMTNRRVEFNADTIITVAQPEGSSGVVDYRLTTRFDTRRPASAGVMVQLDAPLPSGARWFDVETRQPLSASPVASPSSEDGGRRWRVRPINGKPWAGFTVVAPIEPSASQAVPLAAVQEAARQTGRVSLGPRLVANRWVEAPGLRPESPDDTQDGADSDGVMVYRYEPGGVARRAEATAAPALKLRSPLGDRPREQAPVALLQSLTTRFGPDGFARHTARYSDLRPGADFVFVLPEGARLSRVTDADGSALLISRVQSDGVRLDHSTLADAGTINVQYTTDTGALEAGSTLMPVVPAQPAAPAAFAWRIELPPGLALSTEANDRSWLDRVSGVFAAPRGTLGPRPSDESRSIWAGAGVAYNRIVGPEGDATLRVVSPAQRVRLALAALLVAMVLAAVLLQLRPNLWLMLTGCGLAGALVLPTHAADVAASVWLGGLLAVPLRVVVSHLADRSSALGRRAGAALEGQTTATHRTTLLLAVMAAVAGRPIAMAQPPEPLLAPINDAGDAVGDKVYASEDLLARLLAEESRKQQAEPGDVLIRSAEYRGEMVRDDSGALAVRDWSVRFELTTFARGARVQLPLRRGDADWPATVLVDGEPRPLTWNEAGDACWFEVDRPGAARAVLVFRPAVVISDGESCVQVAICPLRNAALTIDFPADHRDVRAPFAPSSITRRREAARLTGSLASLEELLVCWTDDPIQAEREPAPINLRQWLRVSERGVFVDVQAEAEETGVSLDGVRIETPTGAERIDPPTTGAAETEGDGIRRVAFRLPRETPLGVVRPPLVSVTGGVIRSQALAVSIDDAYQWSLTAEEQARPLDADEFLASWSRPLGLVPDIDRALLVDADTRPAITVRPMSRDQVLAHRLELLVESGRTICRYEADFAVTGAGKPSAVRVPGELNIVSVVATSDGEPVGCRWTRPRRDRLVVLAEDAAPIRQLTVTATAPKAEGEAIAPLISEWSTEAPLAVVLSRAEGVLIETVDAPWETSAAGPVDVATATPVATAEWSVGDPPLRYRVAPNPGKFDLDSVTRFERSDDQVSATWLARVTVTNGDRRRFPLRIAPGVAEVEVLAPGGATITPSKQLGGPGSWLTLPKPLNEGQTALLSVGVKLTGEPATRPPADPLRVAGQPRGQRSVAVPRDGAEPGGRWRITNLQTTAAPDWLQAIETAPERWRVLKKSRRDARAGLVWLPNTNTETGATEVMLCDSRVALGPNDDAFAQTVLLVNPRGASSCLVRLPLEHQLLSLAVDGVATPLRCAEASGPASQWWEVTLRNARAPAEITVVSSGPLDGEVVTPEIVTLEGSVRQPAASLYEIATPADRQLIGGAGLVRLSPAQLETARRQARGEPSVVESAGPQAVATLPSPLASGGRRIGFIAEGRHTPPTIRGASLAPVAARWAAAVLVLAATFAGATRDLWAKRLLSKQDDRD